MYFRLIPFLGTLLIGTSVHAQYSLGGGDALDANTSQFGPHNSSKPLPTGVSNGELRENSILQGRSFNQDLGRSASNAANLQLLSDAANEGTVAYQEALYNTPWYWNNWSSQSAQFMAQGDTSYFNPNFIDNWATAPQQMSTGRGIRSYSHEWSADSASKFTVQGELESPKEWSKRQLKQYKLGQALGDGNSEPSKDTSPIPVGEFTRGETKGYLTAAPMTGITAETTDQPTSALGFSAWDAARIAEDEAIGNGNGKLVQPWRTAENRLEETPINLQVDISEQYNQVLKSIEKLSKQEALDLVSTDEADALKELEYIYSKLQEGLTGIPFEGDDLDELDSAVEAVTVAQESELTDEEINTIAASLRHGEKITQFAGNDVTRFDELLQLGEQAIDDKRYFEAQKRFNQALQFIPGHPLATAGLGNAQIGAGLYLSAGYVLQSLLSFQPEMIDVTFDSSLLPPRIELVRAGVEITKRLKIERDAGTYGFLLAYIGHQIQDLDMVQRGLQTLQKYTDDDDPLVPLLKSIWIKSAVVELQDK